MAGAGTGWYQGVVKAVPSGDTAVIMGRAAQGNLPPEKTITLTGISAPRFGRRESGGREEPFAWEAREFLRKLLVSQAVRFKVEYSPQQASREFGQIYLGDQNVTVTVVLNGWAALRDADSIPCQEDLKRAQKAAQQAGSGMWSKEMDASSKAKPLPEGDEPSPEKAFDGNRGKEMSAIVEAVLSGSVVRLLCTDTMRYVTMPLAGVQAPSSGKKANGEDSQPLAREARFFTECRALHRDVMATFVGYSPGPLAQQALCSVKLHGADGMTIDLAEDILASGYGRFVDTTAAVLPRGEGKKLKEAEGRAKEARKGLWKDWQPQKSSVDEVAGNKSFEGVVLEVLSGDTYIIEQEGTGVERRIQLASTRAPRLGNSKRGIEPEKYSEEAKEFARKTLIGKHVSVTLEYTRKIPGGESGQEWLAEFGSITFTRSKNFDKNGTEAEEERSNMAELLLLKGLATAVRHKKDEERASNYESMLAMEQKAKEGKHGLFSDKDPPPHRVNDLTQAKQSRISQFLPFLQRAEKMKCLVLAVFSGNRLKLHIPSQSVDVVFTLSAAKCPSRGQPFADEALSFIRKRVLQRYVEVSVNSMDRSGSFLGALRYDDGKRDLSSDLLAFGLASMPRNVPIERIPGGTQLAEVEEEARQNSRGVWSIEEADDNGHEEDDEELGREGDGQEDSVAQAGSSDGSAAQRKEGEGESSEKQERLTLCVTEVVDRGCFYAQLRKDADNVERICKRAQELANTAHHLQSSAKSSKTKPGALCLAKFSQDNCLYRAKVTKANESGVGVFFMDFGNSEVVQHDEILPLPPELSSTPPLARYCTLSFVKVPSVSKEWGHEALQELRSLIAGAEVEARVDEREKAAWGKQSRHPNQQNTSPEMHVTLYAKGDNEARSINFHMVASGLARIDKRRCKGRSEAEELFEAQQVARRERANMWQFGDPGSSEDEA